MGAKVDIVLIDGGDDFSGSGASGGGPAPMPSRQVGPGSSPPAGPSGDSATRTKREDKSTATEAAVDLAASISRIMGGVGLVDSAIRLKKAIDDIYNSFTKLDDKLKQPPARTGSTTVESAGPTGKKSSTKESTSRKKPADEEDFIEGEFEFAGRKQAEPPADPGTRGLTTSLRGPGPSLGKDLTARSNLPANKVFEGTVEAEASATASAAPKAAEGLAAVASKAGPLALAIGAVVVAVGAGAIAIKSAFDAINNEVKRLENVSPDVAVATSMTEVRREMADLRRSDAIGPQLARFETIRSKAEDKLYDLQTQVLKILLQIFDVMEPGFEAAIDGIAVAAAQIEMVNATVENAVATLTPGLDDNIKALGSIEAAQKSLVKAMDALTTSNASKEEEATDPFMSMLLQQFDPRGPN